MQESFLDKTEKPKSNKTLYLSVAAIAVVAVVGIIGCSSIYMKPVPMEQAVVGNEVPHYVRNMWFNWKAKYSKGYELFEEDEGRLNTFYSNVLRLQEWARGPKTTYTLAINQFADLSQEEFAALYTSKYESTRPKNYETLDTSAMAATVDWRTKGAVNDIKNQGQCGSCWAFSAVAALEGAMFLKTGKLESYSEQQLVDCSKNGNQGCNGGLMDYAFEWWEQAGNEADYERDYTYTAQDGSCKQTRYTASAAKTTGYHDVTVDSVDALKAAITKQVVSVAVEADRTAWQFYDGGVLDDSSCGQNLDHGVAAVGYGTEDGTDYWLVRNSWGTGWGEEGYIKLAMHVSEAGGQCGILKAASYPSV